MNRQLLIVGLTCLIQTMTIVGEEKQIQSSNPPTNAGFEKLKTLVGTWVLADENGQPTDQVASVIRLTAGGSAVHETLFPGEPQEMISIYTADGSDVVMTHYCVLGNQPQMRAQAKSLEGDQLHFEFVGGTNLDPTKDMHMHSAVLTFVDENQIEVNGIGWEDGKPAKEMCCGMKFVRKK